MKNLNPLYEGSLTKDPKKWANAIKNANKKGLVKPLITSKQKEAIKKAKAAATEARKSGKQPLASSGTKARGGRGSSGIPNFVRGFGETI